MYQAEKDDTMGANLVPLSLHDSQTTIRLRCERIGTLESLHYAETAAHEVPLQDNWVEVELAAAGLNSQGMGYHGYHQTITSKVRGTWNPHNVALERKLCLDFFTMLPIISGVVSQKGQASYAAANVFLDNFSAYRHNLGLSACSIDLGAIEDVEYLSEHSDLAVAWDSAAWTPINEGLFHKIFRFSATTCRSD